MRISVVIPVYNQAQYLEEAVISVLSQTKKADEIIIVNDGSTDHFKSLEANYLSRFPVIKVINQVNKGLPSARNTGIMNATGDYFFPLDADDILLENCLEEIEKTAIQQNYPDVIAPSLKNFGLINNEVILGHPTLEEFKSANRIGYFSAIKLSVLKEIGGYNPKMVWGYEDYDLWFDIFKRGKTLATIPKPLVLYRTKEKSMLTESRKHHDELMGQIRLNHPQVWS